MIKIRQCSHCLPSKASCSFLQRLLLDASSSLCKTQHKQHAWHIPIQPTHLIKTRKPLTLYFYTDTMSKLSVTHTHTHTHTHTQIKLHTHTHTHTHTNTHTHTHTYNNTQRENCDSETRNTSWNCCIHQHNSQQCRSHSWRTQFKAMQQENQAPLPVEWRLKSADWPQRALKQQIILHSTVPPSLFTNDQWCHKYIMFWNGSCKCISMRNEACQPVTWIKSHCIRNLAGSFNLRK